ncbi:MFS transporter [Neomicrococcus lactis]|uniref:MFS transporter n=1 Tax=Neomicrococcus lactis TaxID=732241 RepID=UPI002301677A|nr:MFS transporter [Neomicrococcus lactis]
MIARKYWLGAALSLLMVGWGANQFASLLALYRQEHGISELAVTAMLGIYVLGLIPALLRGGTLSDQRGRAGLTRLALVLAVVASVLMIGGSVWLWLLFVGRFVAGVATGLAMAVTTSWVKELSQAPYDDAAFSTGAQRGSLYSASGFMLGAIVAGLLASFAPLPQVLPYAVHIALSLVMLAVIRALPETLHPHRQAAHAALPTEDVALSKRRFARVVGPAAPWVFGSVTTGFAVVPAFMANYGVNRLLYATACVGLVQGFGVLIQPLARKLDTPTSARALLVGMSTSAAGLGILALAMWLESPALGLLASTVLGCAYGTLMVSGLLETQRLAPVGQLGSYNGKYYTIAYIGFLGPTILAFVGQWLSPWWQLGLLAVLLLGSIVAVAANSRTALPRTAN